MDYDRNDALLHWLFRQTQGDAWFRPNEENISSGVALRISDLPEFRVFPYENPSLEPFETAVAALNPAVAVKIRSAAVHAALASVPPDDTTVYVDANTRIQILDTMLFLPTADKEQCAAFIRDERVLVIWSDALDRIIPTCTDFEERLIKLLWRAAPVPPLSTTSAPPSSLSPSLLHSPSTRSSVEGSVEALASTPPAARTPKRNSLASTSPLAKVSVRPTTKRTWYGRRLIVPEVILLDDREKANVDEKGEEEDDNDNKWNEENQTRKTVLWAPLYNGLAAVFIGAGVKTLFQEWMLDGGVIRFALLAVCPLLYCVSLFFALQIIQNVSMVIGPIEQYHSNSTYYSAVKPVACAAVDDALPHVTIQMPVYKEGLEGVLVPSILSLKRAMQTYARQGGTSSIFVCDDGLRVLPPHEQVERVRFYAGQNIGWVARPGHGAVASEFDYAEGGYHEPEETDGEGGDVEKGLGAKKGKGKKEDKKGKGKGKDNEHGEDAQKPFLRAGRFKKASNLNYGLALSLRAEHHLAKLLKHQKDVKEALELHAQQQRDREAQGDLSNDSNNHSNNHGENNPNNNNQSGNGNSSNNHSNNHGESNNHSNSGTESETSRSTPTPTLPITIPVLPAHLVADLSLLGLPSTSTSNGNAGGNASTTNLHGSGSGAGTPTPGATPNTNTNASPANPLLPSTASLEDQALALAIAEHASIFYSSSSLSSSLSSLRPWASNGRNVRMGEILLLVDSDTIVPEDCLRDAAREMRACPDVAIIQHESDVMQVAHHYFENGIAYFTKRINRTISMACANGEVAPFVGHNAFLRWRALQDAAFVDPADGLEKIWSESNVSEDFDMALRLMGKGYIIRCVVSLLRRRLFSSRNLDGPPTRGANSKRACR
ncbi:hypothetical protein C0991_006924 [Blastosporella zonata]|nr:hypothetical protein C0991_006924 [Blastosporella zonata]